MTKQSDVAPRVVVTEQTPLLEDQVGVSGLSTTTNAVETTPRHRESKGKFWILCPLFIGVFIANADTSLVLASYTTISSEFSSLRSASWLLTGYMLSMCSAQPLYGKLSNIFGRKALLIVSYVLFGIGNVVCGAAPTMAIAITGRFIAGAGGAGMSSVVSYLIADLLPIRDVATYRSYVNIVTTVGRSCGGPLGGKLTEMIGWRWTFLCQAPLTAVAILLVSLFVPSTSTIDTASAINVKDAKSRIRRVDFLGSFVLCMGINLFLLSLTLGGNQFAWTHPAILSLATSSGMFMALFILVESRWAIEPIFPLYLLRRWDIVAPYGILLLQNVAQTFMMYSTPLYFQVTANATPSIAGYYLVPAILGNTIGGLGTAVYIKKFGRFKIPTIFASLMAALCHTLLLLRWNGNTSPYEALYVIFGGLGTGIAHSSTFIAVTSVTTEEEVAIAGGGLYLCGGLGSVVGVAAAESTLRAVFRTDLIRKLGRSDSTMTLINRSLKDMNYLSEISGDIKRAVIAAYVKGFKCDFGLALLCCAISLVLGLLMRNLRLPS